MTGGFGISKSIAIIMYIRLAQFHLNYYFEAKYNKSLRKEFIQLLKSKLLERKVIKYFYWTVTETDTDTDSLARAYFIRDKILQQVD